MGDVPPVRKGMHACATSRCSPGAWAAPASSRGSSTASPPARLPGRRRRRRGHRRRQHRRRPLGARPQGLPRPRHRHVHPRRRHRPRARLGPPRRDLERQGRSSRRTAWSRPGSASATATSPPTWSAPRCSTPATRSPQVTEALCRRWLARSGPGVRLLPMTDDRVETHVAIADPDAPSGRRVVHFQEYWVRLRAEVPGRGASSSSGSRSPRPAPGVIDAITDADLVVLPPSQPGGLASARSSACPRVREALAATRGPGRRPLPHRRRHPRARHGRADAHRRSASRSAPAGGRPALRRPRRRRRARRLAGRRARRRPGRRGSPRPGSPAAAVPLMMTDHDATAAMAAAAVELVAG